MYERDLVDHIGEIGFMVLLCICCFLLLAYEFSRMRCARMREALQNCERTRNYLEDQAQQLRRDQSEVSSVKYQALAESAKQASVDLEKMQQTCAASSVELAEMKFRCETLETKLSSALSDLSEYRILVTQKGDDLGWYAYPKWKASDFLSVYQKMPVFEGVYAILNETADAVYVQVSDDTVRGAAQHLLGGGSFDVRRDLSAGHRMFIRLYPYVGCGYASAQDLCSALAVYFQVYVKGYRGSYGK